MVNPPQLVGITDRKMKTTANSSRQDMILLEIAIQPLTMKCAEKKNIFYQHKIPVTT